MPVYSPGNIHINVVVFPASEANTRTLFWIQPRFGKQQPIGEKIGISEPPEEKYPQTSNPGPDRTGWSRNGDERSQLI